MRFEFGTKFTGEYFRIVDSRRPHQTRMGEHLVVQLLASIFFFDRIGQVSSDVRLGSQLGVGFDSPSVVRRRDRFLLEDDIISGNLIVHRRDGR